MTVTTTDTAELAARFLQALTPLTRKLRTQVESGMTQGLTSALGTVAREGPITLGDLADVEHVTPPMATKLAKGLEERGLVRRVGCTDDRRVTRLELTAEGRAVIERGRRRRRAWLATRIAALTPEEQTALEAAADVIERLNREASR